METISELIIAETEETKEEKPKGEKTKDIKSKKENTKVKKESSTSSKSKTPKGEEKYIFFIRHTYS